MSSSLQAMTNAVSSGPATSIGPFDPALGDEVQRLIARLDSNQRAWLSGYLAGTLGTLAQPVVAAADHARPIATILYGSHSGNCEQLAKRLGEQLSARGLSCVTLDMLDCRKNHLQDAQHLLVVVSTHGEGDPPDRARPLYELLHGRKAPKLEHLQYSVLALGDSSYEKFCETGRRFDAQLEALGARRLHDRAECDVDFASVADTWIGQIVERIASAHGGSATVASPLTSARPSASVATAYTRKNPWRAPVLVNQRLTSRDSSKDVRHIELSIEGAGIHYEPGDALGIVPRNHALDVGELLENLAFAADAAVTVNGVTTTLQEALTDQLDIGLLTRSLVERYAAAVDDVRLRELCAAEPARLDAYLYARHLVDLVVDHPPAGLDAVSFVQALRPLAPRLYSIASSPRATPDEVHLTVSVVGYESFGRKRHGVVSGLLADLNGDDVHALVYPHRNPAFRLPSNQEAPIIMIGPGTGVAPFRAFVAEREALDARGRNWLFFGDRSMRRDFLYQTEWLDWRKRGVLHRLDVAFSRDGDSKVYVQHRMREQGRELYGWLQNGAHLYVCGDAQCMAPDVEQALRDIVRDHGGLSADRADEYLLDLQRDRRYQKDVY